MIQFGENYYLLVHGFDIPSMCAEFDPGPDYDYRFFVIEVGLGDPQIQEVGLARVEEIYQGLETRSERIELWKILKYVRYVNSDEFYSRKDWEG